MKKVFILPIIFLILIFTPSSEQQPQVVVPTVAILPAPTLHPQFIALQEQIAASGARFALLPDGMIEEQTADGGRQTVPGISVDKNGVIALQVGDQQVDLSPADVSFDDRDGITIRGYGLDESTGSWVTVARSESGLEIQIQLGETDEQGARVIDQFAGPANLTDQEKAKFQEQFDAERLGFVPDATVWKQLPDGRLVLVDANDPRRVIAEWKRAKNVGNTTEVVWDWDMMKVDGENVLLHAGVVWEIHNDLPVQFEEAGLSEKHLMEIDTLELLREMRLPASVFGGSVYSEDRTKGVPVAFVVTHNGTDTGKENAKKLTDGAIFFKNIKSEVVSFFVENFISDGTW